MCTRVWSKKLRGSKSMNYIAAGLSEAATDDQGLCFQLTSKKHFSISLPSLPKAAQGAEPPAQGYLNYLLGIVSWCYFPSQSLQTVLRSESHLNTPSLLQPSCAAGHKLMGCTGVRALLRSALPVVALNPSCLDAALLAAPIPFLTNIWRLNLRL